MRLFASTRFTLSASAIAIAAAWAAPSFAQTEETQVQAQETNTAVECSTITDPAAQRQCADAQNAATASATTSTAPSTAAPQQGAIVITGSRIKRPNLESPVPVTSISQQELTNQGQVSVGDALNDLPALRSTFSQQNSGRFIGTAGQNFLDLRGLGTNRTLVLVNGRRFVTAAPGSFDVDVDNIPQDLIDRIDVVTGGESAIYGSDAVAGVVNFILKRDFNGLRIRGQEGISSHGDRNIGFVSATAGHNFADDRGNVAINLEYTHAEPLFFRDRKRFRRACGFEPNELPGTDDPNVPDNVFVCGIRVPFITVGGQVALLDTNGQGLAFDPSGNLVITPPADRSFIENGGDVISDNPLIGATLNETGQLAVGRDRYMANLLGHFEVSDALKPFIEATFVHQKVDQEGQPSFFVGRLASFFGPVGPQGIIVPSLRCDNPFLTPENLATLQDIGFCVVRNTIPLNRFNVDLGARREIDFRNTYRVVSGVTGDFNQDWHYEVSVNYGRHHADNAQHNDLQLTDEFGNPAGFTLAVDAVRDANGNIVCRVNADADPTNDAPGCVPINLFGEGRPSQAAINFVNRTSHLFQTATEFDVLGFLAGDSSQWFSLPGGAVGFSLGAEYRRETAKSHADAVSAAGGTFFNAFPRFDPPSFKVTEAFGELNLPILKDLPLAHELTVSGAARYSHYNTSAGNTFAWNANAIYSPVRDLRLRGNYSKSVRVPTLGDLFTPATVNFAFVDDPCDQGNIGDNPNRAANCAALGVPTTILAGSPCASSANPVGSPFVNCIANQQTIQITSAGNPNLEAETGKSLTLGGILTPRWIPGLSFSVDYFDIKVTNLIAVLGAQQILNLCVDQPNINNQFCALIFARDEFGLFQSPALLSAGVNFAKQVSRGIDFDLAYNHRFANGHRLDLRGFATYTLERTDFTDPTNSKFGDRILGELGDPVFSATGIVGYGIGGFDLRYTARYIGSMTAFAFEDTHSFEGRPPQNPDVADRINTGSVWYHDVRFSYTIDRKYEFYAGVDNIFNRQPPLGFTGSGGFSAIYNNIGRYFYAGAVLNFDLFK